MDLQVYEIISKQITTELLTSIVGMAIAFMAILSIKSFLKSLYSFYQFRSNMNLRYGDWVLIGDGSIKERIRAQIVRVTIRQIILESSKYRVIVPMQLFLTRDWIMCKHDRLDNTEVMKKGG